MKVLGRAGGVAVELGGVADVDAADLAGGHFVEIGVEDADLGAPGGLARGVGRGAQVGGVAVAIMPASVAL